MQQEQSLGFWSEVVGTIGHDSEAGFTFEQQAGFASELAPASLLQQGLAGVVGCWVAAETREWKVQQGQAAAFRVE
jgi:hypothetical protein